jgi:hypothetical protein
MEFQDLGKHCHLEYCKMKDFLPFTCNLCKKTCCLEHKNYDKHDCIEYKKTIKKAFQCPTCLQTKIFDGTRTEKEMLTLHKKMSCDPKNAAKIKKIRKRCAVKKCWKKLTPVNKFQCNPCEKLICTKHRDPEKHGCEKFEKNTKKKEFLM